MTKTVLAFHDISCVGRCSLTVALPIISNYGIECRVLPTALLSTHTGGFTDFTMLDLTDEMKNIFTAWRSLDLHFDAIYSGFMPSKKQIDVLKTLIQIYPAFTIIDPVMADNGSPYSVFDNDYIEKMKELIPFADVLIPNVTEACLLAGVPYRDYYDESYIQSLIVNLKAQGAKQVVITGIRLKNHQIGAASSTESRIHYSFSDEISGNYPGTGDIFGSVLTSELMNGRSLKDATEEAVQFVVSCIKATPIDADKRYGVNFEQVLAERNNNAK